MEYQGKLYGKIGDTYFDTGRTSDEFDQMERKVKELEEKIRWIPVHEKEPECTKEINGRKKSKTL